MVMSALHSGRGPAVFRDLAVGLVLQGLFSAATWGLLDLPATYMGVSAGLYLLLAILLAILLLRRHPERVGGLGPGLGTANRVTFGRSLLVLPVMALVPFGWRLSSTGHWWIILVATAAMSLDALDGRVARRTGTESRFGARFDMELDAFLLLGLSVLVWGSGMVGWWVILVGGLRYLFVAAGWIWPVLRGDLPESVRRKTVCVVQGVVLLVCLGPIIPSWFATAVAAGALALLGYSFAVDVRWLVFDGSAARCESATRLSAPSTGSPGAGSCDH
ncbi:MAG TPA: CDP-alcohol phosphatidyltransferase family protein [Gammaproteobacteria bacterium]|nr:CDP-alcohol phosphatidyltransferase family protein [Gammaproteobacteria bacterium]